VKSIESWLEHLADANGLTTAQLLTLIRRDGVSTRYLTLAPAPGTITHLAALTRVDPDDVAATTLAAYDGTALDLTGLDVNDRHSYRQVAACGWAPAHGTQICPACLADTNTWQQRVAAPHRHRLHPPPVAARRSVPVLPAAVSGPTPLPPTPSRRRPDLREPPRRRPRPGSANTTSPPSPQHLLRRPSSRCRPASTAH
jgi:hypothetical protein